MLQFQYIFVLPIALMLLLIQARSIAAESFTVASYNLERYLVAAPGGSGMAKTQESKRQAQRVLKTMAANIVALQEVGGVKALDQLRDALKTEGWHYPYAHLAAGQDTNLSVAVLSQYPIVTCRSHTNLSFLLNGRRIRVQRGFAEVDIRVSEHYQLTVIVAHLKSKLASAIANEDDIREQEALLLREIVDARLAEDPKRRLVVAGDLNDTQDSPSVKIIVGKGKRTLLDTRPAEKNGDDPLSRHRGREPRTITWTHYYAKEDTYSRIDYLLLSPGMAADWNPGNAHIVAMPQWGLASDHRPIVATFPLTSNPAGNGVNSSP